METRDQKLSRLHDGELEPAVAAALRAELTDEDQQKLQTLAETSKLISNTLSAEAEARPLDLWADLEDKLVATAPALAARPAQGKILPLLRRRTVRVSALLSTLAAAAGLVVLLRPFAAPSNRCDIEELDVAGQNAAVITLSDGQGRETSLIWFDHQETDAWESL